MDEPVASFTPADAIAIVAVIGVVIAAAVGAAGALVSVSVAERRADRRHREQLARDDRLHEKRIEREDRYRFLGDRREMYASFMRTTTQIVVRAGKTDLSPLLAEADSYFQQVCLIAPDKVAGHAQRTWALVTKMAINPPEPDALADQECMAALDQFGQVAREDLRQGIPGALESDG